MLLSVCAAMALCINLTGSCSADDDYFGLDDESYSYQTRAATSDTLRYLTLSTYDQEKWTDEEFATLADAAMRMGVYFSKSKNKYVFSESNGKNINVSDSLYDLVKSQFEHTNSILNAKKSAKVRRRKTSSIETIGVVPNCVPTAISHMGQGAPSYEDAIVACDTIDPGWLQKGGVASNKVGRIIRVFTPVTSMKNVDSFGTGYNFNQCVMLINQGGNIDHAVNATHIITCTGTDGNSIKLINYKDFTDARSNDERFYFSILSEQISAIFTF